MDRRALIAKLVTTLHLNVPERKELGDPPRVEEIADVVIEHLLRDGFFPGRPWREGQLCADGTMLELLPDGRVRAQHQVASPNGPWFPPSHIDAVELPDVRTAALHLIECDFPKDIDGVPVISE